MTKMKNKIGMLNSIIITDVPADLFERMALMNKTKKLAIDIYLPKFMSAASIKTPRMNSNTISTVSPMPD